MKLLYTEEHIACHLYRDEADSMIIYREIPEGSVETISFSGITFVYVMGGDFNFSSGRVLNRKIISGNFFLIPPQYKAVIQTDKDTSLMMIRLNSKINFCDQYPLEIIFSERRIEKKDDICVLKTNKRLSAYFSLLHATFKDGLKCENFFELKQKELLFYLRAYYSKEDLCNFFSVILCRDLSFSEMIYENADKIKTLKEMAALTHYSLSGIKKRFQQVFGISPSRWLMQERAKKLYHEINCNNKSFKLIAIDFGFSSASHLVNFCKTHFDMAPGEIRSKNRKDVETMSNNC